MLNWIRHFNILVEGANPEDAKIITRSLGTQIQSLKLRGVLANDPVDALLAAIALVGVALCNERGENDVYPRLKRVHRLLDTQIDEDGM